jgi:hypothetical protein
MPPDLQEILVILEKKMAIIDRVHGHLCKIAEIICSREVSEEDKPIEPTELW